MSSAFLNVVSAPPRTIRTTAVRHHHFGDREAVLSQYVAHKSFYEYDEM